MALEHVAIWTEQLEVLKDFYAKFFDGVPNEKYTNEKSSFKVTSSVFNRARDLN
jgi:lactoylglutathione lyase